MLCHKAESARCKMTRVVCVGTATLAEAFAVGSQPTSVHNARPDPILETGGYGYATIADRTSSL
jgi:hypothetical protein